MRRSAKSTDGERRVDGVFAAFDARGAQGRIGLVQAAEFGKQKIMLGLYKWLNCKITYFYFKYTFYCFKDKGFWTVILIFCCSFLFLLFFIDTNLQSLFFGQQ